MNYVLGKSDSTILGFQKHLFGLPITNTGIFRCGVLLLSSAIGTILKDDSTFATSIFPEAKQLDDKTFNCHKRQEQWIFGEQPYMVVPTTNQARACPYCLDHHKGRLSANNLFQYFPKGNVATQKYLEKQFWTLPVGLKHDRTGELTDISDPQFQRTRHYGV